MRRRAARSGRGMIQRLGVFKSGRLQKRADKEIDILQIHKSAFELCLQARCGHLFIIIFPC